VYDKLGGFTLSVGLAGAVIEMSKYFQGVAVPVGCNVQNVNPPEWGFVLVLSQITSRMLVAVESGVQYPEELNSDPPTVGAVCPNTMTSEIKSVCFRIIEYALMFPPSRSYCLSPRFADA